MGLVKPFKIRSKTNVKGLFACEICGQDYTSRSDLANHMAKHAGITYTCDKCGKNFIPGNLLRIMPMHIEMVCISVINVGKHLNIQAVFLTMLKSTVTKPMCVNMKVVIKKVGVMLCTVNIYSLATQRNP